jgi:predicted membrane-bound dolichyl-phosphate-mannose-protein mannosyltransferase
MKILYCLSDSEDGISNNNTYFDNEIDAIKEFNSYNKDYSSTMLILSKLSIDETNTKNIVDVLNSSGEVIKTNGYDYKNMEVSK